MIKNLLRQEKGIALTVAAFVMVALLLIAIAFFISTQSESAKVLADKAGVNAIVAANVGAERAIWLVQQKLDNDPNWQPNNDTNWNSDENELPLFNTEYNYFNFKGLSSQVKNERMSPDEYAEKCVQIGATQPGVTSGSIGGEGSLVYAAKMQQEDDPNTTPIEWAIYSIGIDRTASILGAKAGKMEIRVAKVIVRLGTITTTWLDDYAIVSGPGGSRKISKTNVRLHISGGQITPRVYMADGWNDDEVANNPGNTNGHFQISNSGGWRDGWEKSSNFIFETPKTSDEDIPQKAKEIIGNENIKKGVNRNFCKLQLDKFGIPGSGAEIIADYYYLPEDHPDYDDESGIPISKRRNLINRGWKVVPNKDKNGNVIRDENGNIMKSLVPEDYIDAMFIWNKVDSNIANEIMDAYEMSQTEFDYCSFFDQPPYDGYTVIYIPEDGPNFRTTQLRGPGIGIMPGEEGKRTHAMIVALGKGRNLCGKNGENRADANGYNFMGTGYRPPQGGPTTDMEGDNNVSIEIRAGIGMYPIFSATGESFMDFIWKDRYSGIQPGKIVNGELKEDNSLPSFGSKTGTLAILSKYNIILGTEEESTDIGYADPQIVFRGILYSQEGSVRLQEDLLLRGSIMAAKGVEFVDQSELWQALSSHGDGFDIAICHENARRLDDDENESMFPIGILPTGGAGTGRIQIIAWENISGYKQIQDTF